MSSNFNTLNPAVSKNDLKNLRGNVELLRARTHALKEAEKMDSANMKYGLGIGIALEGDVSQEELFRGVAKYAYETSAGDTESVKILPWQEAMKDEDDANVVGLRLAMSETYLKNYYFAKAFGNFSTGLVVQGEEESESEVKMHTEYQTSSADIVFVWAPRSSHIRVVDEVSGSANCCARTFAVFAEENARVEVISLTRLSLATHFFANKFSHILAGAKVSWTEGVFGGKLVKSDIEDFLIEAGAETEMRNISLAAGERFDFYNAAHHIGNNTISRIAARGIIGAGGKTIYRGVVDVKRGVKSAVGTQEAKFLLAAPDAEVDAIPALDVGSPDTRASHSLSVGHLHEGNFFYPGLRGLAPYEAQAMLFEGFLMHGVPNGEMRKMIQQKLSSSIYHV
ncbi:SufD family Fe-S cluster assembly protein [bacterium]|nr:SufD family Fe-S cluster assembly protein [bacterium]